MNDLRSRLIIALDYPDLAPALDLAKQIGPRVGMLKVGLELFNSAGPHAIESLRRLGARIFYDSKFSDIPNTVAGAAAAAGRMGVSMLNVHALGGRAMMQAAKEAALDGARQAGFPSPLVIGVTVVTSLGDRDLREDFGLADRSQDIVLRLASLARESGLDGVVCAVEEVGPIKRVCGKNFLTVTPGIRPAWAASGDQARVATPQEAIAAGADYLVIGRPVTRADDPGDALTKILREMTDAAQ
ncbi:MAG: orotidine-5'-phosphate decarboxylase [Armatimonadota bacterium]|nr:MAG: orotidine-5'-phosphate decarboxylase [Armatimonadota bacterium]